MRNWPINSQSSNAHAVITRVRVFRLSPHLLLSCWPATPTHPPSSQNVGPHSRSAVAYECCPNAVGGGGRRCKRSCIARAHGLEQVHKRRAESPHTCRGTRTVSPSSSGIVVHGSRAAAIPQPACFDSRPGGRKNSHAWFSALPVGCDIPLVFWTCMPTHVVVGRSRAFDSTRLCVYRSSLNANLARDRATRDGLPRPHRLQE